MLESFKRFTVGDKVTFPHYPGYEWLVVEVDGEIFLRLVKDKNEKL